MGDWYDFLTPDGVSTSGGKLRSPDKNKPVKVVPVKAVYDQADYVGLCAQAGFGNETVTAARVAWRETRGRPRQINPQPVDGGCKGPGPKRAHGMFQFVPSCHPGFDYTRGLSDPAYSAKYAADYVKKNGWGAWEAGTGKVPPAGLDKAAGPLSEWTMTVPLDADRYRRSHLYKAIERGYLDGTGGTGIIGGTTSGALDGPIQAIPDAIDTAADAATFFTSWSTWRRVLLVTSGGALVIVGLLAISSDVGDPLAAVAKLNPTTAILKGATK